MKDKMDLPDNSELVADQNGSANQKTPGVDASRRRLFGAGVAAPVILSMSSRTAWGGALCAPSAFNSATFASHHPEEAPCTGLAGSRPSTWLASPNWPSPYAPDISVVVAQPNDQQRERECRAVVGVSYAGFYLDDSTNVYCRVPQTFNAIFGVNVLPPETTLMEVLLTKTGSDIEAHAVAALLNAASGKITLGLINGALPSSDIVVAKVVNIFRALMSGSGYELPSTRQIVYWDADPNNVGFTMYDFFNTYAD